MATLHQILLTAWGYLSHFWYYLVLGIVVAGLLRTFVPKPKLERIFGRAGIIPILVALVAIARQRIFYVYLSVVFLGAVIFGYLFQMLEAV